MKDKEKDKQYKTVNKAQLSNGEIRYYEDTFAREQITNVENIVNNISINKQDKLTSDNAGDGIAISYDSEGNVIISNTNISAEWGNISGTITDQQDLIDYIENHGGKIDTIYVNGVKQFVINKGVYLDIPTKVSDLDNDLNFVESSELDYLLNKKEDKLTEENAGKGIIIDRASDGSVIISAVSDQAALIPGQGIDIEHTSEGDIISSHTVTRIIRWED